jgi:hypothetical protein
VTLLEDTRTVVSLSVNEKLRAISEELHLPPMRYVVRIGVESVWDMGPGPHAGERLA